MKQQIEKYLSCLIGLSLTKTSRAANMECLRFETSINNSDNNVINRSKAFALHLQCPWRFTNVNSIITGNDDLYHPINEDAEYDENFDWDEIDNNLRDFKLQNLINNFELLVQSIIADEYGGIEVIFTKDIKLSVFPTLTRKSEYSEFWRFFEVNNKTQRHFVVGTFGIET